MLSDQKEKKARPRPSIERVMKQTASTIKAKREEEMSRLMLNRIKCFVSWPLLFLIDIGIACAGVETWRKARRKSANEIGKAWNRSAY